MQAYRAYYDDGKFIPFEPVKIEKGSQAIVTILDFPVKDVQDDDINRRKIAALRKLKNAGHSLDPQKKVPKLGCMKGRIWMSDDFDEPLDDFKEYM